MICFNLLFFFKILLKILKARSAKCSWDPWAQYRDILRCWLSAQISSCYEFNTGCSLFVFSWRDGRSNAVSCAACLCLTLVQCLTSQKYKIRLCIHTHAHKTSKNNPIPSHTSETAVITKQTHFNKNKGKKEKEKLYFLKSNCSI